MALLFALSSVNITLNLSKCFSNYTSEQQIYVFVIERLSLINVLCMVYFMVLLIELMYTEHHSVVSFFMGSHSNLMARWKSHRHLLLLNRPKKLKIHHRV